MTKEYKCTPILTINNNKEYLLVGENNIDYDSKNILFLSQCPGKNFTNKLKNIKFERRLKDDILFIKNQYKVSVIINLLNKYELRILGIDIIEYQNICKNNGIILITFPIIEMSVPDISIKDYDIFINNILQFLENSDIVLIHCRGGVGRAGLIAGSIISKLFKSMSYNSILKYLRKIRNKKCVESMKQEDYLYKYINYKAKN